jgi:hypothetical protein
MPGHAEWPKAIAEAVAVLRADNPTCGKRERAVPLEREGSVVSPPPSGASEDQRHVKGVEFIVSAPKRRDLKGCAECA